MLIAEKSTRITGGYVIVSAFLGILINLFMFFKFLSFEKTSFYIMCTSKTVSNFILLTVYFLYIGPTDLLYTQIGPLELNTYLNQTMGLGMYLQGPLTQMMITINRFLVIWFTPTSVPKYSTRVTVTALSVSWVAVIWLSTLVGLPVFFSANCRAPMGFEHIGYYSTPCNNQITIIVVSAIFLLALFTNSMNLMIAGKLIWGWKKAQSNLSSEASQLRRRTSVRFFIQSCIQDWICVMDVLNNMASHLYCSSDRLCISLALISFGVLVYGADGLVMYLFNYKSSGKRDESRDITAESMRTIIVSPAPI
ncbi:CRE-SRX-113 protein [Caenorhabditis remanei]|uniref:CRE-SRX-113 protein n=1 Tax=Caenorhabditis remanei TaxID=31234 RepID=E3LNN4_CAERE|nr:CRE-SRX-113 protein [Caenorhabditis remanei]